jgi:hypothetical protein
LNNQYNIWNKWDPLKTVMLGDCYGPEFFRDIKNSKIRSALTQIAEETQEDLAGYETVLRDFGCSVLRPKLDPTDSILNYLNSDGKTKGKQGVPRSPLQPRDCQLVIGDTLFYTAVDHSAIKDCLDNYNSDFSMVNVPMTEQVFLGYKGDNAPEWPTYDEYVNSFINSINFGDNQSITDEFADIHQQEKNKSPDFPRSAPGITVIGKDIYLDMKPENNNKDTFLANYQLNKFKEMYSNFRHNVLHIGGHNDGCFHTIKPGVILSLNDIQRYHNTFPGWDVCYLPDQSWSKVEGFLKIKKQVEGKWWVPEQEDNNELTHFVETWLQDWVGFVEETVFDVNVLVLDEHHVCVSNMNPTVNNFLKKHNIEPVHVPWRHRYFWDGGLHCLTLDLYREGVQQDYFPNRRNAIQDIGFD